jgi:hypothetical protein
VISTPMPKLTPRLTVSIMTRLCVVAGMKSNQAPNPSNASPIATTVFPFVPRTTP